VGGMKVTSPIKAATAPVIGLISVATFGIPWLLLVATMLLTFAMLVAIVKLLRSMVLKRVELLFDRHLFRTWPRAFGFGLLFTVAVQTSSIPTSLVVPLAAAGILRLAQVYPFNLGSNVGTTFTAMLAALATANETAITVAFSHTLFNIFGIALICSIPPIRRLPLRLAERLAEIAVARRAFAVGLLLGVYFIVPLAFVVAGRLWTHLAG
jgi:sodium-dependent phosphate cotransporter